MRISVAIPCYKYHIPVLRRCLDSIAMQTRLPDEVIVSCSSCKPEDIPVYSYPFPLRIITFQERKNAAENRNIATDAFQKEQQQLQQLQQLQQPTDILSYFDADDVMHPQRLEAIEAAFKSMPKCDIVLHGYWMGPEKNRPWEHTKEFPITHNLLTRAASGCAMYMANKEARIHHSQVSVSVETFSKVKFNEGKDFERREDSVFCGDVLSLPDVKSAYIMWPLSKFYEEGVWHPV
jgi:glycosyltransferase involved in cell wall biosynthesis